jgi:hypothetical protein
MLVSPTVLFEQTGTGKNRIEKKLQTERLKKDKK